MTLTADGAADLDLPSKLMVELRLDPERVSALFETLKFAFGERVRFVRP